MIPVPQNGGNEVKPTPNDQGVDGTATCGETESFLRTSQVAPPETDRGTPRVLRLAVRSCDGVLRAPRGAQTEVSACDDSRVWATPASEFATGGDKRDATAKEATFTIAGLQFGPPLLDFATSQHTVFDALMGSPFEPQQSVRSRYAGEGDSKRLARDVDQTRLHKQGPQMSTHLPVAHAVGDQMQNLARVEDLLMLAVLAGLDVFLFRLMWAGAGHAPDGSDPTLPVGVLSGRGVTGGADDDDW